MTRPGRSRTLARLARVQEAKRSLAEWRLLSLRRRGAELAEGRDTLIASLNADTPLHGRFVESMARHLRRIETEASRLAEAVEGQSASLVEEARRLKQAERLAGAAALEEAREDEKRALFDEIDRHPDRASLP